MVKRPRDAAGFVTVVVDMATGEVPNDKDEALAAMSGHDSRPGRAKGAKAQTASQTPERRSEIARKAAATRWSSADGAESASGG